MENIIGNIYNLLGFDTDDDGEVDER